MKKYLLLIPLFALPFAAFADTGFGEAFTHITSFFSDVEDFLFVETPSLLQRFWAWLLEWYVLLQLKMQLESIQFAWGVAKVILEDLSLTQHIQSALSALPSDMAAFLVDVRFIDAINIVFNARVTRFVLKMI